MAGVFLSILNMSISASWIVLSVLVLRLLLKRAPKWINTVLWGVVGLRLVMPFSVKSIFSLMPSAQTVIKAPNSPRPVIQSGVTIVDARVNEYLSSHYYEGITKPAGHFADVSEILAIVWIAGIAVLLTYSVVSCLYLKSKVKTAVLLRDNIMQSENVASPFVLGVIRPMIYLPFNLKEQDAQMVIAHENAHISRRDHWWKPVGFLLLAVYWFNPCIWLAYILLCRDIELACDENVIKNLDTAQKADYSQALLSCSISRRTVAACPIAFGEVGVKCRIKRVLNYKKPAFWIVIVAIVASSALAVCFLTDRTGDRDVPFTKAPVMIVVSNEQSIEVMPGDEWLNSMPGDKNKGLQYSYNHPLAVITNLPRIDILPTYYSYLDPLSALISFNVVSGDPGNTAVPDEMYVDCWRESEWYSDAPQSERIPIHTVNGNMYINLIDGNCVYEVVAVWNRPGFSGTVRYPFHCHKNTMTLNIRSASIMEITALGKGGFCQVLDDGIIDKVVDKVNQITFAYGKDESAKGNGYEIRLYDNKAQLIDKIIMMSDKVILYGRDNANYIAIMNGSLGYDYIDQLFRQSNPQ